MLPTIQAAQIVETTSRITTRRVAISVSLRTIHPDNRNAIATFLLWALRMDDPPAVPRQRHLAPEPNIRLSLLRTGTYPTNAATPPTQPPTPGSLDGNVRTSAEMTKTWDMRARRWAAVDRNTVPRRSSWTPANPNVAATQLVTAMSPKIKVSS